MAKTNYKEALSNKIFEVISQASAAIETESYVIGGFVRDLLLKRDYRIFYETILSKRN